MVWATFYLNWSEIYSRSPETAGFCKRSLIVTLNVYHRECAIFLLYSLFSVLCSVLYEGLRLQPFSYIFILLIVIRSLFLLVLMIHTKEWKKLYGSTPHKILHEMNTAMNKMLAKEEEDEKKNATHLLCLETVAFFSPSFWRRHIDNGVITLL